MSADVAALGLIVLLALGSVALAVFLLRPRPPATGPTITQVLGAVTHGQAITIVGHGFGRKPHAAPVFWDDFTGGTEGKPVGEIGCQHNTNSLYGPNHRDNFVPVYDAEITRGRSDRSCVLHFGGTGIEQSANNLQIPDDFGREFYLDFRYRYTHLDALHPGNIKRFRLDRSGHYDALIGQTSLDPLTGQGGSLLTSDHMTGLVPQPQGEDTPQIYGPTGMQFEFVQAWGDPWDDPAHIENTWMHYQLAARMNTAPGVLDGVVSYSRNCREKRVHGWCFSTTTPVETFRNLNLGNYGYATVPLGWQARFATVYVDASWARVEIGDRPVYGECTQRQILYCTAWAPDGTRIQALVHGGDFADGAALFLFVVDPAGTPSAGHPVTLAPAG